MHKYKVTMVGTEKQAVCKYSSSPVAAIFWWPHPLTAYPPFPHVVRGNHLYCGIGMAESMAESKSGDFTEVRKRRKRKSSEQMETDGTVAEVKRPSFPPVDASVAPVRERN